jgi:hypothetical protein
MFCSDEGACVRFGAQRSWDATRKSVHVLPPVQAGRALPRAHSITCFTGFNSRIKSPKDQKTKALCARRDAIAQRSSPGLASNRSTVKPLSPPPRHLHQVRTDASVTIRLLIPTPRQRVIRISAETDDLAKSGSARPAPQLRFRQFSGRPRPSPDDRLPLTIHSPESLMQPTPQEFLLEPNAA